MSTSNYLIAAIFLVVTSCFQNPDFSLSHTKSKLAVIKKKVRTNEELDSKELNLIFKTLKSDNLMNQIEGSIIAESVIYSKQKNLVRAYIEFFLKSKRKQFFKNDLRRIYKDNPNLVKRYLEYFGQKDQRTLKSALTI